MNKEIMITKENVRNWFKRYRKLFNRMIYIEEMLGKAHVVFEDDGRAVIENTTLTMNRKRYYEKKITRLISETEIIENMIFSIEDEELQEVLELKYMSDYTDSDMPMCFRFPSEQYGEELMRHWSCLLLEINERRDC